jgi:hypothetical protein
MYTIMVMLSCSVLLLIVGVAAVIYSSLDNLSLIFMLLLQALAVLLLGILSCFRCHRHQNDVPCINHTLLHTALLTSAASDFILLPCLSQICERDQRPIYTNILVLAALLTFAAIVSLLAGVGQEVSYWKQRHVLQQQQQRMRTRMIAELTRTDSLDSDVLESNDTLETSVTVSP